MADDIVARLRDWKRAADGSGYGSLLGIFDEAADEIERLRRNTGCARNQGTTQFCAEALDAQREIERLRSELRNYTGDHHTIHAARRGDPSGVQTPSEGNLE